MRALRVFHPHYRGTPPVSSSSFITSTSEAKHCFLHSLSYWSRKTLESNMSELSYLAKSTRHALTCIFS